jgi:hypothetical protein
MFGLSDQQPQAQERRLVVHAEPFHGLHGCTDLGDLMCGVIDGLTKQFERHAVESVKAKLYNESQFDCECA